MRKTADHPKMVKRLAESAGVKFGLQLQHSYSNPVAVEHEGQLLWLGVVEVFKVLGSDRAKECYAWPYWSMIQSTVQVDVAVLRDSPIDTPEDAAQWVVKLHQKNRLSEVIL